LVGHRFCFYFVEALLSLVSIFFVKFPFQVILVDNSITDDKTRGRPVSCQFYEIAFQNGTRIESEQRLWWAIIGLTSAFLNKEIKDEVYEVYTKLYVEEIRRIGETLPNGIRLAVQEEYPLIRLEY